MDLKTKNRIRKQIIDGSIYYKKRYKLWREKVLKRDGYKCQMPRCKRNTDILNVHHLKMKYYYPELIYNVDNGITLCRDCHFKLHKRKSQKRITITLQNIVKKNNRKYHGTNR